MKAKILMLLRERNTYVSGQELCQQFGVSRTAIWKAIGQLKKEGYTIEAVQNKGYLLVDDGPEAVFGQHELESRLQGQTNWIGKQLTFYSVTDSTNAQAKLAAEQGDAEHGALYVADMQTLGRGRRGREWKSPAGTNIYFTLLLKPQMSPDKASMLTLVMAMAVAKGIGRYVDEAGIKWPNDIVVDGRKACGILTEMSLSVESASIQYVVVGVGINVGKQEFSPELQQTAISLEEACGKKVPRSMLLGDILECFEKYYDLFLQSGDLSLLQEEYNTLLVNVGRRVRVLDPKGEFEGEAEGITKTGELLVKTEDGTVQEVYAGEVSVRGIYGYV